MDQVVSFDFFIRIIRKQWRSIVAFTIGGLLVAFVITFFVIPPRYESSSQILVNRANKNATTEYAGQAVDSQMITTYKELITNRVILTPARHALKQDTGITRSLKEMKQEVTVTSNPDSQVFSIEVSDRNADDSATIANQVAKTFKRVVPDIIKVNNVTIVSPAQAATSATFPKKAKSLIIGTVIGLFVGIIFAVARMLTDRRVHSAQFLTKHLGLNNLGTVSHQPMNSLSSQKRALQLHRQDRHNTASTRQSRHER